VVLVSDIHAIQIATTPTVITSNDTNTDIYNFINDTEDCYYLAGSTVPNQPAGAFWAIVNRFLIIFETIILLLSELSFPQQFFKAYFPVLGPDFGVGALGIFECLIGAAVLSHHVDSFPLVSAFFLFSIGCLNILIGLIFRDSSKSLRSITEWRDRVPDLPRANSIAKTGSPSYVSSAFAPASDKAPSHDFKGNYGFGRQGEKAAALKGFLISKPLETLPRYAPKMNARPDSQVFQSSHAI